MLHPKLYNLFHKKSRLKPDEIFLVAEIGKNFIQTEDDRPISEYLANAKHLIDEAHRAGADAVKFQTHEVEDEQSRLSVVSPHFKSMERYKWLERNTRATPPEFWAELKEYAESRGLIFFSTPMSRAAAEKLDRLNTPLWKVGSGDVDDYLMLERIVSSGKPVIISSGMVSLEELDQIMKRLLSKKIPVGLLYCVSKYPCPPLHFNLSSIERFRKSYPKAMIGFSDHSVDSHDVALAAIKLGARMIEKHFSMSRDLWGPDHKASLTPSEFAELVRLVRSGEYLKADHGRFYGEHERELEGANNQFRPYFKKTLVAARDIPAGKIITADDLCAHRPRMHLDGLSPQELDNVIGRAAVVVIEKHAPIKREHIS